MLSFTTKVQAKAEPQFTGAFSPAALGCCFSEEQARKPLLVGTRAQMQAAAASLQLPQLRDLSVSSDHHPYNHPVHVGCNMGVPYMRCPANPTLVMGNLLVLADCSDAVHWWLPSRVLLRMSHQFSHITLCYLIWPGGGRPGRGKGGGGGPAGGGGGGGAAGVAGAAGPPRAAAGAGPAAGGLQAPRPLPAPLQVGASAAAMAASLLCRCRQCDAARQTCREGVCSMQEHRPHGKRGKLISNSHI
jgi:hypothetical protein